jgi:hypothetical protein
MKKHPDSKAKSAAGARLDWSAGLKSGRINYPPPIVAEPASASALGEARTLNLLIRSPRNYVLHSTGGDICVVRQYRWRYSVL